MLIQCSLNSISGWEKETRREDETRSAKWWISKSDRKTEAVFQNCQRFQRGTLISKSIIIMPN